MPWLASNTKLTQKYQRHLKFSQKWSHTAPLAMTLTFSIDINGNELLQLSDVGLPLRSGVAVGDELHGQPDLVL